MRRARVLATVLAALAVTFGLVGPATATSDTRSHRVHPSTIRITGEVDHRASYSVRELAREFPAVRHGRMTGVSLHEVVLRARGAEMGRPPPHGGPHPRR